MEALGPHLPGPGAPSRTVAAGNGAVPPVDVRGTRRMFLIVEDAVEVGELSSQYRVSSKTVPTWLFAPLQASTHANCKSWEVFEKFRKFAT